MEVFLPTCGAAQEKQSAEALPCSNPNALPLKFVWGFWPLAKTGAIPRTGFQQPVARLSICVPGACTITKHHAWSRMCQDVQRKEVFKDHNLAMCEPKELVTERHCWPSAEDTRRLEGRMATQIKIPQAA